MLGRVSSSTECVVQFDIYSLDRIQTIPFVLELRSLLDWVCTDSTLSLFHWLKMEDIYANIYILKCYRTAEKVRRENFIVLCLRPNLCENAGQVYIFQGRETRISLCSQQHWYTTCVHVMCVRNNVLMNYDSIISTKFLLKKVIDTDLIEPNHCWREISLNISKFKNE